MSGYLEKWQCAADDLLSVLIVKPTAWIELLDAGIAADDLPPGKWRDMYRAVIDLRSDAARKDITPTDTEIAVKAGPEVTVIFVATRIALYDAYREKTFGQTCDLIKRYGRGHRQYEVLKRGVALMRAELENGADVDSAALRVVDGLQAEEKVQAAAPTDIGDIVDLSEKRMIDEPTDGLKTGVWLIDDWLRGLAPGELVAWVAPYKMRKTSVMANVLVNMARQKKYIDVFSFDEERLRFIHRLEAVLMAEWMYNSGHWNAKDDNGIAINAVDGKMITNAGNRWLQWDKRLQLAREYARDTLLAMRGYVRVYDRRTCAGTLKSIRAISRLNASKCGQLDMIMVDHIQRLGDWTKTYDQVEFGSAGLHDLGGELGAVMWALSQQNEAAIKTQDDDWSPNAKGGGGLASNADTVLVSKYRVGTCTDDDKLRIELKLARDASARRYGYVEIHPTSGWITPRRIDTKVITQAAIQSAIESGESLNVLDLDGGSYV
jgi:hypothetical protein